MIKATLKKLSRRQLDKQKVDAVKAEIAGPRRSASAKAGIAMSRAGK